jgi:hypothetical protein
MSLHGYGYARRRRDRFHDLRRQSKAHILRHDFQFLHVAKALSRQVLTTSCTRCSGADAPAVSHRLHVIQPLRLMLRQSSIRCAGVPKLRATSTNRLEFELLSEPTTSSKSASEATCFTATCLFSVA